MNETEEKLELEIEALAGRLPRAVAPQRDLWPGIEDAINTPARPLWNTVWAQAAAVLLLVAGSSGVTWYVATQDDGYETQVVIDMDNRFATVSGAFGGHFTLGNDYLEARDALEESLQQKLAVLDTESREDVVRNLNAIRVAIQEINSALASEPDNALLRELLLSTYHEEMALMQRVDGLANTAMRRNDI